jgi:hypothetical protein
VQPQFQQVEIDRHWDSILSALGANLKLFLPEILVQLQNALFQAGKKLVFAGTVLICPLPACFAIL